MLRRFFVLAFLCVFFVPAAVPAQQPALPSVDEIAKKNTDARGGLEKIRALQSVRFSGKLTVQGFEIPTIMTVKRPGYVRMESTFQGTSVIQAYDGTTGWMVNPFAGAPSPTRLAGAELDDVKDNADLDGSLVDYKAKGLAVELVGKEDFKGTPVYKLKISKPSGSTEFAYIDANSFLQVRATSQRVVQGQSGEIDTELGDYKPVNGVLFPFKIETKTPGAVISIVLDKSEANVALDDAIFKFPGQPATEAAPKP
jgi:outer membrane lipoprotein-sorting protein